MKKGNAKLKTLQKKRQENKISIVQLANCLNISKSMYSYLENGERRLSYRDAIKIATLFKTTPDELFYKDYHEFFKEYII